jgi:hypothetical protein
MKRAITYCGVQDAPSLTTAKDILGRCLDLLEKLDGRRRPEGSERFASPEECRDSVSKCIEEKLEAGQRFNQEDVEFFLFGIESKGRQLRRALAPYRRSDILDEARKANP